MLCRPKSVVPTRSFHENVYPCLRKNRLICARLAQSVERGTFNPKVKGSSPLSGVDTILVQLCHQSRINSNCDVHVKMKVDEEMSVWLSLILRDGQPSPSNYGSGGI